MPVLSAQSSFEEPDGEDPSSEVQTSPLERAQTLFAALDIDLVLNLLTIFYDDSSRKLDCFTIENNFSYMLKDQAFWNNLHYKWLVVNTLGRNPDSGRLCARIYGKIRTDGETGTKSWYTNFSLILQY